MLMVYQTKTEVGQLAERNRDFKIKGENPC